MHTLASQLKAKNTRVGLLYNDLKIEWDENRNKKALEYNIDVLTILYGVIPLKTNNFPALFKGVKHTFPIKLFLNDIRFPTSADFNLSHEPELIWLAWNGGTDHVTKQKLKSPRYLK